jgi:hypothetical protein
MGQLLPTDAWSALAQLIDARTLGALGAAYLALLANLLVTSVCYAIARATLLISPNKAARDYGLYTAVALIALLIMTVLDNQLRPEGAAALPYAAMPHLLLFCLLHLAIYYRQEPWLIALGVAGMMGAMPLLVIAGMSGSLQLAHGLAALLMVTLVGYVFIKSISTKRGFLNARSIYVSSKEQPAGNAPPQTPWLGLGQWVGLAVASLGVATLNELLRGLGLADVGAARVAGQALLLLAVTAAVCAVPATTYWLARHSWMPELTRFAWLVWIMVGFAQTYGNYLSGSWRA